MPVEGSDSARVRRFASGPSRETRLQFVQRIGDAYGLVLILILTTFVVTMTLPPTGWAGRVAAVAVAGLTAIIALTSSDVRLGRVRLAAVAALGAVIATALARAISSDALLGIAFVVDALLLAVAAVTILRRVLPSAQVDFRTILGAISVFTLLGLLFGFLFLSLGRLQAGNVFSGVSDASSRDYLFFSYTTLTTTGYGNLVPSGDIGQILAVFEMLTGQIFLVTLVAGLVSLWRPGSRAAEKLARSAACRLTATRRSPPTQPQARSTSWREDLPQARWHHDARYPPKRSEDHTSPSGLRATAGASS